MLVQRVVAPMSGAVSWTVVDVRFEPVEPAEAYLAHLVAIERSPNTVRAYASSLRLWFEHLDRRGVAWDANLPQQFVSGALGKSFVTTPIASERITGSRIGDSESTPSAYPLTLSGP